MKITEIKKLKRLYSVKLDEAITDEDTGDLTDKIYVTEDTIVKFRLSKEADYDKEQIREIIEFANYSRGKNLAIYYISFKIRTQSEVRKYLIEHEIPENDIPRILDELESLDLINDRKYIENYVSTKILGGQTGPFSIQQKLLQKGLAKDLIEDEISKLYDEEKRLEIATKIADKQARAKSARLPLKQLKMKISQTLVSKGFSYAIAEQALVSLELEADEENEAELLMNEAEKAYNRLFRQYDGYDLKNRLSQTLGRKGFDWSDISDILENFEF
ncbi:MAG: recombination regulator RecX [Streptococcaceae bacterium]|jgi:regulatory protein|nr:recombination regulator RecX [Streptococcaceae bacterium]